MPTLDPPDDTDLFALLEAEMDEPNTDDVEDVTLLNPEQLMTNYHAVERNLREIKELIWPRTREGRDLHSKRSAYQLELRKRHLM